MREVLKKQKGVAVLMSVIITSLLLIIATAMANIFTKELKLSIAVRDSHIAFYMADQGFECAIYHDVRLASFDPDIAGSISCAGLTINNNTGNQQTTGTNGLGNSLIGGGDTDTKSIFTLYETGTFPDGPCALVFVEKNPDPGLITEIESRGYNTCNPNRSDRIERAIRIRY